MAKITIQIENMDIEVECEKCGLSLKAKLNKGQDTLSVEPCDGCMSDSYNDGYDTRKKEE
jgi:Zn finger protein HypA/HybF involved in hydrogenase expression